MRENSEPSERGQAVVLIVLAMVVLLGFTALAVDGSMVYSDRRFSQNGADASSLAAGSTAAAEFGALGVTNDNFTFNDTSGGTGPCTGTVATAANIGLSAGIDRAHDNNFEIDTDYTSDNHGVQAECGTEEILGQLAGGGTATIFEQHYADFTAMITHETQTAFAQFVFRGPMVNTVTAVTRVRPRNPLAYGFAIVALNPDIFNCNPMGTGAGFQGASGTTVEGGGIFSNGCMKVGSGDVAIDDAGVYYFGEPNHSGIDDIVIDPPVPPAHLAGDESRIPTNAYDIPMPDCTHRQYRADEIINTTLSPGLYCVMDTLRLNGHDTLEGDGVTLVLFADADLTGGESLNLTPPTDDSNGGVPGVVIYSPNPITIKIAGNSDSSFQGTILAPKATINFEGTSDDYVLDGQLIGWNVKVTGTAALTVRYPNNNQAMVPALLDLYR